jgi:hypothetical protein
MKRWEYKIIDSKDIKSEGLFKGRTREAIERYLGELGDAGWEIVNLDFNELKDSQHLRPSFTGIAKREKA